MSISTQHPDYIKNIDIWKLVRDSFEGEDVVKAAGTRYLPPTAGQLIDGMKPNLALSEKCMGGDNIGLSSYMSYLLRAHYPDFFAEGVQTVLGILNSKPALFQLPEEMKYLLDAATPDGQDMNTLLRMIQLEQLVAGRIGLLADFKVENGTAGKPYIAPYLAETIINWDSGQHVDGVHKMNLVVLDESGLVREGLEWREKDSWRVLRLGNGLEGDPGHYSFGTTDSSSADLDGIQFTTGSRAGKELDFIPFVCVGPRDLDMVPDTPPLIGLARLCMLIYRAEADYRYALYMQAQETLVISGGLRGANQSAPQAGNGNGGPQVRVGADSLIQVDVGGDAKYIGVSSNGLPEQRASLDADRQRAAVKTGQLLQPGKASMESGEALKTRIAAQTATLTSVAISGASGLQRILRHIATWMGLDPEKVVVTPNLEFTNFHIQGQDIVQLVTAKRLGAPISSQTIHAVIKDRGMTNFSFEEEIKRIEQEPQVLKDLLLQNQGDTGNNPTAASGGPAPSTTGQRRQTSVPRDQQTQ